MTDSDLKRLREFAEAATPGPWAADIDMDPAAIHRICAAHPQAVLALLDEIERMAARVTEESDNRDYVAQQLAAAQLEIERLRMELRCAAIQIKDRGASFAAAIAARDEACDLAEEGWAYAGEYFRDKWGAAAKIAALREVGQSGGEK